MRIEVIALDVFGTVLDMSSVNRDEIRSYVANSRDAAIWSPLVVPESWLNLKAHPDAREGIRRLRQRYQVVTLSNGPVWFLDWVMRANRIELDGYIPIEMIRKYKPDVECYRLLCRLMAVDPAKVLMVTANPTFGDLAGSAAAGMKSQVIRVQSGEFADCPADLIELVDRLS